MIAGSRGICNLISSSCIGGSAEDTRAEPRLILSRAKTWLLDFFFFPNYLAWSMVSEARWPVLSMDQAHTTRCPDCCLTANVDVEGQKRKFM